MSEFNLRDATEVRIISIQCTYCSEEPTSVPALIFHREMESERDLVGVFCQGDGNCDGGAWGFPAQPDNSLILAQQAHDILSTDN